MNEELEKLQTAIVSEISDRDQRAKMASVDFRRSMQVYHQKSFGEWGAISGDPPELADYFSPQIGRRIDKLTSTIIEMICPDPEQWSNVMVRAKDKGVEISPDVDVLKLIGSRKRVRLREIALTQHLQDAMRECGFYQLISQAIRSKLAVGNIYGSVTCDHIVEEGASGKPIYGGDMEDYETSTKTPPGRTIYRYTPTLTDPRNLFPCSMEDTRGINFLEWWTEYDVATWYDFNSRRAEKNDDGEWEGRYFNLDVVGKKDIPQFIHRIFYDDIRESQPASLATSAIPDSSFVEKGWRICRYVGVFGPGDVSLKFGGEEPSDALWDRNLKFFGNTPEVIADRRNIRWWVIEVAYGGKASLCSGGTIVRFEPHPLFKGKQCPMVMDRFSIYSGRFLGCGIYTGIAGDEELWNIAARCKSYATVYAAMPASYYRPDMIDPSYLEENQNTPRLTTGAMIPLRPESGLMNNGLKPLEFVMPSEGGYEIAGANQSDCLMNIDQRTGVGDIQFGQAQRDVTATVGAAAQQNAYTTAKDCAVLSEICFVTPMANMLLQAIVQDVTVSGLKYCIDSYSDARGMKGMHEGVDAIMEGVDEEMAENIFPATIDVPMEKGLEFEVIINAASGGRAAQIAAMEQFYVQAGEINMTSGSPQFNMIDIAEGIARAKGFRNPEDFRVDPEEAARQQAILQQKAMQEAMMSGGSPEAGSVGVASQPAEPGGIDPAAAANPGGMV